MNTTCGKKAFFSEKKKQKTFMLLSRVYPAAYAIGVNVFWFFFSKKNFFGPKQGRAKHHIAARRPDGRANTARSPYLRL